jgi:hypothetical protein
MSAKQTRIFSEMLEYSMPVVKKRYCKTCNCTLRSGNNSEYCALHIPPLEILSTKIETMHIVCFALAEFAGEI